MMQAVGRRYVGGFNARYRRTGTLWEGRFKAARSIDTDHYLLTCYRYIELNPVRAHMTDNPANYPWSSYHHNAMGNPRHSSRRTRNTCRWPPHPPNGKPSIAPWSVSTWKSVASTTCGSTPSNSAPGAASASSSRSKHWSSAQSA